MRSSVIMTLMVAVATMAGRPVLCVVKMGLRELVLDVAGIGNRSRCDYLIDVCSVQRGFVVRALTGFTADTVGGRCDPYGHIPSGSLAASSGGVLVEGDVGGGTLDHCAPQYGALADFSEDELALMWQDRVWGLKRRSRVSQWAQVTVQNLDSFGVSYV